MSKQPRDDGNSTLILSKLKISIKKAERGKTESIKEKNLMSEKEARGASCEECE